MPSDWYLCAAAVSYTHLQKVLFKEKCITGQFLDGNITFNDFAQRWFNDYADKQLRLSLIHILIHDMKKP